MSSFQYQIGLMGDYHRSKDQLEITFERRFNDLGYQSGDFHLLYGEEIFKRERRAPFAVMYFGHEKAQSEDTDLLQDILADSIVLLPIVEDLSKFSTLVHPLIKHINGIQLDYMDQAFERDVGTILENFLLLRKDRRLFISYKRDDARLIALQLYEELDKRKFDVFLDTHGVPSGEDFQSILWHRLADSDVVVLLDTPNFFESRWTKEEFARANATGVQILHLLWPGRTIPSEASLSNFMQLCCEDFNGQETGDKAKFSTITLEKITIEVESLRARALAGRHRSLVSTFCDEAKRLGIDVNVQPSKHVVFQGRKNKGYVMPLVGVPSSQRLHEVYQDITDLESSLGNIWAIYDSHGLQKSTIEHFSWLNASLPLKTYSVHSVFKELAEEASK